MGRPIPMSMGSSKQLDGTSHYPLQFNSSFFIFSHSFFWPDQAAIRNEVFDHIL